MTDIIHLSCSIPFDDFGSFGVFFRHYSGLDKTLFRVRPTTNPAYLENLPAEAFPARIPLPTRLPWHPPLRLFGYQSALSYRLRFFLLARHLDRFIARDRPSIIVTHLWDYYSFFAGYYAKTRNLPLIVFLHDNPLPWASSPGEQRSVRRLMDTTLAAAHRIYTVTPELAAAISHGPHTAPEVLAPMPTPFTACARSPRSSSSPGLTYAFAGSRFPGLEPFFENLASHLARSRDFLLILGTPDAFTQALQLRFPDTIRLQKKFPTSAEALQHLDREADRLIIAYPPPGAVENTQWASLTSSFPSRLVEYAALQKPVLIFADSSTALAHWCRRLHYPHLADSHTPVAITALIAGLDAPDAVETACAFFDHLSKTEFSAAQIQSTFSLALTALAST